MIRELILNIFSLIIIVVLLIFVFQSYYCISHINKYALILDIKGSIINKPPTNNKFWQISQNFINNNNNFKLQENSLFDIINIIRQASNNTNVLGLILMLKNFTGADQESLQYIGKSLQEFKKNGKKIYAIGENYTQAQYFLASYANIIYLTPQGKIDLHGISINNFYYKTLLDKLKIKSYVFRVGQYKSAVEPFLRNNMSNDVKKISKDFVNKFWQNYLNVVSNNRQIPINKLFPCIKIMINDLKSVNGDSAQFAMKNGLIDKIYTLPVIENDMIKIFGLDKSKKSFNAISIYNYKQNLSPKKENKIGVIVINGIINTKYSTYTLNTENINIINQIRDSCFDPSIKAIVLRINSPGGSVNAAELIRSELINLRSYNKPIVVSMGGIAASGGYWISTSADIIIANNNTITGSIGIFGILNTIENSLKSIGIYNDGVSTSLLSDISITKKLSKECIEIMQLYVRNGYENFINLVAKSRKKSINDVHKIAQGRIWIGHDAFKHGLVDNIGDFDDAICKAAKLSKITDYQLYWYTNELKFTDICFTQIINNLFSFFLKTFSSNFLKEILITLDKIDLKRIFEFNLDDPKNIYAFCPINEGILN